MNSGIFNRLRSQVLAGVLLMLVGAAVGFGVLAGCEQPVPTREQYRVLKYFFDGVPDPDHPKPKLARGQMKPLPNAEGEGVVVTMSIMSRHKPYVENKCAACHQSAGGTVMDFDAAYTLCIKCHTKVPTERARMHGPVAVPGGEGCQWCHAPHESNEKYLLKDAPVKVCTQCHDQQLLGPKPMEHSDGKTSCLNCHFGHGGTERYFLKPVPTSMPATMPAGVLALPGSPATMPATAPAGVLSMPDGPTTEPATAPAGGDGP